MLPRTNPASQRGRCSRVLKAGSLFLSQLQVADVMAEGSSAQGANPHSTSLAPQEPNVSMELVLYQTQLSGEAGLAHEQLIFFVALIKSN